MKTKDKIWAEYEKMVGTKITASGSLFGRKELPSTDFDILAVRKSVKCIRNMKTGIKNPAYELLLKNDSMRRSRWSSPFPIREIKLR